MTCKAKRHHSAIVAGRACPVCGFEGWFAEYKRKQKEKLAQQARRKIVIFPIAKDSALPRPVQTLEPFEWLRQHSCANQTLCLNIAVNNHWDGFSCDECEAFTELEKIIPIRVNNGCLDLY